jgi:myo-inositol 2-dehydrogenase / D-chiro-inositol 1-dehydrogenase
MFLASIATNNFHNQAEAGAESAISCIMARMSAEKKREVTWEEVMKSKEVLDSKINLSKLS